MGYDVFISYSHRDRKVADAACARLEQADHRCWIAPRDIHGGEWGKSIIEGINGARVFVLVFSAHANRSPQVNREVERAVSKGLPIIPFRIEDVTPSDSLEYFISNQHWLDALTPPRDRHLVRLVEMVGHLLGEGTKVGPAALPEPRRNRALRWWAGGIAAMLGIAALGAWMLVPRNSPANQEVARAPLPAPQAVPAATGVPVPVPVPGPPPALQPLLADWVSQRPDTEPGGTIEAETSLRRSAVPVSVERVSPAGGRLVFTLARSLYDDQNAQIGERIGDGRTLLVFEQPERERAFFTLRFAEPLAEVRFSIPSVKNYMVPESDSPAARPSYSTRVTSPGFTVTALDRSGQPIPGAQVTRPEQIGDQLAQNFSLHARGAEGIAAVRFATTGIVRFDCFCRPAGSQPRPFHGFLFSDVQIRRMAPGVPPAAR